MKIAPNFGAILFKRIADYLHSLLMLPFLLRCRERLWVSSACELRRSALSKRQTAFGKVLAIDRMA